MSVRANALPEALYERNPCRTPHPAISLGQHPGGPYTCVVPPHHVLSHRTSRPIPSHITSYPAHITSYPPIPSYPAHITSYPAHITSFPPTSRHIPLHITSYPIAHHVIPA